MFHWLFYFIAHILGIYRGVFFASFIQILSYVHTVMFCFNFIMCRIVNCVSPYPKPLGRMFSNLHTSILLKLDFLKFRSWRKRIVLHSVKLVDNCHLALWKLTHGERFDSSTGTDLSCQIGPLLKACFYFVLFIM